MSSDPLSRQKFLPELALPPQVPSRHLLEVGGARGEPRVYARVPLGEETILERVDESCGGYRRLPRQHPSERLDVFRGGIPRHHEFVQRELEFWEDRANDERVPVLGVEHATPRGEERERGAVGRVPRRQRVGEFVADGRPQRPHGVAEAREPRMQPRVNRHGVLGGIPRLGRAL